MSLGKELGDIVTPDGVVRLKTLTTKYLPGFLFNVFLCILIESLGTVNVFVESKAEVKVKERFFKPIFLTFAKTGLESKTFSSSSRGLRILP